MVRWVAWHCKNGSILHAGQESTWWQCSVGLMIRWFLKSIIKTFLLTKSAPKIGHWTSVTENFQQNCNCKQLSVSLILMAVITTGCLQLIFDKWGDFESIKSLPPFTPNIHHQFFFLCRSYSNLLVVKSVRYFPPLEGVLEYSASNVRYLKS